MPRLFFAIRTPSIVIDSLTHLQKELFESLAQLSPGPSARPEQLNNSHCTLRFLGNVDENRVESILHSVNDSFGHSRPEEFSVQTTQLGTFSGMDKARVVWMGLNPEKALADLRAVIDRGLASAGFILDADEGFHAHLTLVRFRDRYKFPRDFHFPELKPSIRFVVHECVLIESQLTTSGPKHIVLANFPLEKASASNANSPDLLSRHAN